LRLHICADTLSAVGAFIADFAAAFRPSKTDKA
jgi:hypothetical protein